MLKKYKVEMAEIFEKLKYGFSMYEKSYTIIEEALSLMDINIKYPNAILITQI